MKERWGSTSGERCNRTEKVCVPSKKRLRGGGVRIMRKVLDTKRYRSGEKRRIAYFVRTVDVDASIGLSSRIPFLHVLFCAEKGNGKDCESETTKCI